MQQLLKHIKCCLKDCISLKFEVGSREKQQINQLTEKLQNENLIPEQILKLIINNDNAENILRTQLLNYLRQIKTDEEISLLCRAEGRIIREPYSILTHNINPLAKEIFENIKLIQNDLVNLTQIIDSFVIENGPFTDQRQAAKNPQQYSLYLLLTETMQSYSILLPDSFEQLLSRLYLLEQSIYLIIQKTEKVLEELNNKVTEQDKSELGSIRSQVSTKKSALSESLFLFKEKQRKEEIEQSLIFNNPAKFTVIRSDFQLCKPIEKKISKRDRRSFCCF